MAKKRKASAAPKPSSGYRELDEKDARLTVSSYRDVADSQDEFEDEILLDEKPPRSKKQRREEEEEAFVQDSDEDVFGDDYGDDDDDDDDNDEDKEMQDPNWWGSKKGEYYNHDEIQTQDDALEEEKEALRLQKKQLAKMTEADFEDEWLLRDADADDDRNDEENGGVNGHGVVTEHLQDLEIPDYMSVEQRQRILDSRYPELNPLADELVKLHPLLETLRAEAEGKPSKTLTVVQYRLLGCYVAAISMYFALLTSPARDQGMNRPMSAEELHDHEVMDMLVKTRDAWIRVRDMLPSKSETETLAVGEDDDVVSVELGEERALKSCLNPSKAKISETKGKSRLKSKSILPPSKEMEESLAELDALLTRPKKKLPSTSTTITTTKPATALDLDNDDDSDFGEKEALSVRAAADKAARKKSLRFYTSQIAQKQNKRAAAGRDLSGDMDVPVKERLRDRQARLNAAAEKRGRFSKGANGLEVDDDGDGDGSEDEVTNAARKGGDDNADDDEYYDMVAAKATKKKDEKKERKSALAAAGKGDRVVEREEVGKDGKRKITYEIEKNKGLAPKRKKDVRNPRVKKRKKYEDRQKKLRSMKAVYQAEPKGGYAGQKTGIKTGLVRSRQL